MIFVKKHLIMYLLAVCLLLAALSPVAYATETTEAATEAVETTEDTVAETTEETEPARPAATSGSCGDGLSWKLENGTLTVSGSGAMDSGCPWEAHKDDIRKVVFTGGVTAVGAESFADCDNLTAIDFGDAMKEIDTKAFYDCDGLTQLYMPASFRRFGVESFRDCSNLVTVYCAGGMPSFNGNCLWNGNHITIYTPVNNPWPQEHVEVLVNNFGGRLEVMAGGDSMYTYTEPTETIVATEPETEPTTVPTTEPETEPTTVPTTEPTEETVVTEPETTAAAETEATETQSQEETIVEKAGENGWIWMVVVAAGVTALLVLALVIRIITHKGGRYSD